jgi:hypothetical protein
VAGIVSIEKCVGIPGIAACSKCPACVLLRQRNPWRKTTSTQHSERSLSDRRSSQDSSPEKRKNILTIDAQ